MDTRGYIALGIALLLISFVIGYAVGVSTTIRAVVYLAKPFVTIDVDMVNDAIFKYKNNIGGTYYNYTKIPQVSLA